MGLILVSSRGHFAWSTHVLEARDASVIACLHNPYVGRVKWYEVLREFSSLNPQTKLVFPVVNGMKAIEIHVGEPTSDLWAQYTHAVEEYLSGQI